MARVGTSSRALGVLTSALLLCLGLPSGVQAQARSHVLVIRTTHGVADADAQRLDAVLLTEVQRTSGLGTPELASLELAEIELAAGCADTAAACLRAVAEMVSADVVIVRQLTRTSAGLALVLTWFDPSSDDEPRSIEAQAPDAAGLAAEMPRHVRRLFGVPELVVAVDDTDLAPHDPARPGPTDSAGPGPPVVPLIVAAGGAAAVGVGVVFGLLSADAVDRYAATTIRTAADADTALAALDEARSRALIANLLYGAGGALLLVGASWFLIELLTGGADSPESRAPARAMFGVAPLPGGALVSLQGNL